MKQIACIYAEHADAPRVSGAISLDHWNIDKFDDLDKLVNYLKNEMKELWMYCNGQSVAAATFPRKEMIKYFWSKRPTKITITFKDGTKEDYPIEYNKGDETLPNTLYRKPLGYEAYL
jgi:hypothetical protein